MSSSAPSSSSKTPRRSFSPKRVGLSVLSIYIGMCVAVTIFQRELLYFPDHEDSSVMAKRFSLKPWTLHGEVIGYAREARSPQRIWLMLHGNGGQAVDRVYALSAFNPEDSVFILEYPGYGNRSGSPSKAAFNAAAKSGYELLRQTYPNLEVNVLGESLGSGAACSLATLPRPPDRIALVVPFGRLATVAQEKFNFLPVSLMLFDRWDNVETLAGYQGRVDIYGATDDSIIPIHHAKSLADAVKGSRFHALNCGHNDWSDLPDVDLR
jgi:uncharacterized protein